MKIGSSSITQKQNSRVSETKEKHERLKGHNYTDLVF